MAYLFGLMYRQIKPCLPLALPHLVVDALHRLSANLKPFS